MAKSKVTRPAAATSASNVLNNASTGAKSKSAAASALSQTKAPSKTVPPQLEMDNRAVCSKDSEGAGLFC